MIWTSYEWKIVDKTQYSKFEDELNSSRTENENLEWKFGNGIEIWDLLVNWSKLNLYGIEIQVD